MVDRSLGFLLVGLGRGPDPKKNSLWLLGEVYLVPFLFQEGSPGPKGPSGTPLGPEGPPTCPPGQRTYLHRFAAARPDWGG